ncbi:MAG: TlpA family protein disulfide reductase [Desulfovibrionaceae bacterium]|nr:TlpA family protein disulfide reductase [Desulfovibrionaceae bacterium]
MRKIFLCLLLCFCWVAVVKAEPLDTLHIKDVNELLQKNSGKVVMLNFFATWCPPCREEIPELVNASNAYKGKKVAIFGLSVDDAKNKSQVTAFVSKMKVPYPVFMAGKDLLLRFGIDSIPHNVFYDRQGKMVISQPGQCDAEDIKLVLEDLLADD